MSDYAIVAVAEPRKRRSTEESEVGQLEFAFDQDKAVEAILVIANRIPDPTLHSVTHLLYFADKTSLEKYGRFICGDDYYAMEHGPVPSNTYDLLKEAAKTDEFGFQTDGYRVLPLRGPDIDKLSDSDIECLVQATDTYGAAPFWKVKAESHDEAYEAAWNARGISRRQRMPVESIVALLENSDKLLSFLATRHAK